MVVAILKMTRRFSISAIFIPGEDGELRDWNHRLSTLLLHLEHRTRDIGAFVQRLGLFPQNVCAEFPERGLNPLLAFGVLRDAPTAASCTASKACH